MDLDLNRKCSNENKLERFWFISKEIMRYGLLLSAKYMS
jgi:hypothetical protein